MKKFKNSDYIFSIILNTDAAHIASELSIDNIREAFTFYPPDIYELIGEEHIQTLNSRKNYIVETAEHFHKHIND